MASENVFDWINTKEFYMGSNARFNMSGATPVWNSEVNIGSLCDTLGSMGIIGSN